MSDDNTEGHVAEQEISAITHVAIGLVESYSHEQLDMLVELSGRIGNERITTQLMKIITGIKEKAPVSEVDIISLGFLLLLSQTVNTEVEEEPAIIRPN